MTSALKRARVSMHKGQTEPAEPPPAPQSASEEQLIGRLTRAYETGDVDGIIARFTSSVLPRFGLPPS